MYINSSHVSGYLASDPKMGDYQGRAFAKFTVTVNHPNGKEKSYVECVAWGHEASVIGEYAHKGREIYVEGELKTRTWPDRNGMNHKTTFIVVSKFSFGKKSKLEVPAEARIRKPRPVFPEESGHHE